MLVRQPNVGWGRGRVALVAGVTGRGVLAGDSLTALSYGGGGYGWGLALARAPWPVIYNAGVASDTLALLTARWSTDVLAYDPDWVMLRIGTNNPSTADPSFQSQYQFLLDSLIANNIFGFVHAIPPRTGVGAKFRGLCDWLSAQCAAQPGKLLFLDDSIDLGDGSYEPINAYYAETSDPRIHMNGTGKRAQGVRMSPLLAEAFAANDPRILDATDTYEQNPASNQWVRNPLMSGTGGSKTQTTGTVPNNWGVTGYGSGMTNAASVVAADGGDAVQVPWLRVEPQTCANTSHQTWITTTLLHPAIAADLLTIERLDVVVEMRFVGLDASYVNGISMYCSQGSSRPSQGELLNFPASGSLSETLVVRCALPRDQEGEAVVSYAANSIALRIEIGYRATFAASIGAIDIRCASVRGLGD